MNFLFAILLIISGCVTAPQTNSARTALTLDTVDKLELGKATGTDINSIFGAPTVKIPANKTNGTTWIYCDPAPCSEGRLTLQIDNVTNTVRSLSWSLKEDDGTRTPDIYIKRYSAFSFTKKKYIYDFGHYIDRVSIWKSTPAGISLRVDPHNESIINSIYRQDPTKLSNDARNQTNGYPIVTEEP